MFLVVDDVPRADNTARLATLTYPANRTDVGIAAT